MDLKTMLERAKNDIQAVLSNPLAMLGPAGKPFLGLQLMPERLVPDNQFTETRINYKTIVANDGTRYSPVQIKGGVFVGEFDVKLRSSDIGSSFEAQEYDALIAILERFSGDDIPMQAILSLLKWTDKTVVQPLVVKNEVMVWQCIVDALVKRTGDNGFKEDVPISNPAGHRAAALGAWSDPDYNPLDDIYARATFLAGKGMVVKRQIAGTPVINKLLNNPKVQLAARGFIGVAAGGALVGSENRLTLNSLNAYLGENELPPIEKYDKTYHTQLDTQYFLKRDVFVQIAETDTTEEIPIAEGDPLIIENTLGYVGIGKAAGESKPGRKMVTKAYEEKPPRIEGQGWQESFPVNQNPEAVGITHTIT
jgi:Phage major capsid protein E